MIMKKEDFFEPFKIYDNLYFVGTKLSAVYILDTGDGLIMFDTGYQETLYAVIDGMHKMGLNPYDVKYILITHGHIDHMGAAKALREMTGAKIFLGKEDREYANGGLDLSWAKEVNLALETFEPDILLTDGDEIRLGNSVVKTIATAGHTPGTKSFIFDVLDGDKSWTAGLHGGPGLNTLVKEYLDENDLPYSSREEYTYSMLRQKDEKVDIMLANHIEFNGTEEKLKKLKAGDKDAFRDKNEWEKFNLWCVDIMRELIENEKNK